MSIECSATLERARPRHTGESLYIERDDLKSSRLQIIPLYFDLVEYDSDMRSIRSHVIVL